MPVLAENNTGGEPRKAEANSRKNGIICLIIAACIAASYGALYGLEWKGSPWLHTDLEEVATGMALVVGLMAIVNYHSQRQGLALLLGVAFLGTATLDGYHAIVTSVQFKQFMPSDLPSLIPWNWIASRWFLSVFLFATAIVWRLNLDAKITTPRGSIMVYAIAAIFTASSLLFFLFVPLPPAYYPDLMFPRPEEFLPAVFFLLALIGFTWKRNWAGKPAERWIVFSLVVDLCAQTIYMPNSSALFDLEFNAAHILKIVSYVLVFVGLLKCMFQNYRQVVAGEKMLEQQSRLLQSVLQNVEEGISCYDKDLRLRLFNNNYLQMQGIPPGEFRTGDTLEDIFRYRAEKGEYGKCDVEAVVEQKLATARLFEAHEYEHTRPNGQVILVTGNPIGGDSMVASYRDITERVKYERKLRDSEQTLQTRVRELEVLKGALEQKTQSTLRMAEDLRQAKNVQHDAIQNISEGFVLWESDDTLIMCNDVFHTLYEGLQDIIRPGVSFREFINHAYERGIMVKPEDRDINEVIADRIKTHHHSVIAIDEQLSDGRWVRVSERRTSDDRIVGIVTDITERKEWEGKMKYLAENDALTGLPNRVLFQDRLQQALDQADRLETQVAVMVLDLDRFKDVNDTMGHPAGDELLIQVAERLEQCRRKTDTIARLVGDEFAVIATNLKSPFDAEHLARRIVNSLAAPFQLSENEVHTATSIGISFHPQDEGGPDELLRNADVALYRAKADGGSVYRIYDAEIDCEVQARQRSECELRKAIENGEFQLAYQPQFDILSGRMIGAEALLRWNHPERGVVSPGEFIEVAEATRLIIPISEWVLREACLFNKRLLDGGLADIVISVNISPLHFRQQGLYSSVKNAIEDAELNAASLELEITESMAMAHRGNVIDLLNSLKQLGVGLAIDDFGTGFSSLSRLKDFPVDRLKIDQSFVVNLDSDPDHRAICASIVQLGGSMGLKVIAEGVEEQAHLETLAGLNCDQAQGYLYARPLFEEDFIAFVREASLRPVCRTARSEGDKDAPAYSMAG